jgi:hypothetical protein
LRNKKLLFFNILKIDNNFFTDMKLAILRRLLVSNCSPSTKIRQFSSTVVRCDAAYEGTGKTTVTILNEEINRVMVDAFSTRGFILNRY